jgi:hypothetical protein
MESVMLKINKNIKMEVKRKGTKHQREKNIETYIIWIFLNNPPFKGL